MNEDVLYLLWIGGCLGFALGMLTTYAIFYQVLFRKKPKETKPTYPYSLISIRNKEDGSNDVEVEVWNMPDTKPGEPLIHNSHILANAMVDSVMKRDPKEWRN